MKTNGVHLLIEYIDANFDKLTDKDYIENAMLEAAKSINATIVTYFFHKFTPTGVSGAIIIAESHLSIHTWPEDGYAAVDFYTCGNLDPYPAMHLLANLLEANIHKYKTVFRGHPKDL